MLGASIGHVALLVVEPQETGPVILHVAVVLIEEHVGEFLQIHGA